MNGLGKWIGICGLVAALTMSSHARERVVTTELEPVVVSAESDQLAPLINEEFGQIYGSKKISTTRIAEQPSVPSGEMRKLFNRTPGVYVSEMGDPSVVNLTIRGIGEPHESQDVIVFQNGMPIQSTLFGYPTLYYAPANEFIEEVQVFKGGSSLLYGPQPAGAINFVTRDPVADRPLQYDQTTLFGSHGLVSTYQQASGTSANGKAGYLASFYHRQSNGFRAVNSDYTIFNGNVKLFWDLTDETRLELEYSAYDEETGEAGRLTLAQWQADPNQVLPGNVNDRLFLRKHVGAVTLSHEFSPDVKVITKTFGHYQQRMTRRNNGAVTRTDVDDRLFRSVGNDTRFVYDYDLYEGEVSSTFTGGWTTYYSSDPNRRNRFAGGATLNTAGLPPLSHQDRETFYQAIFMENLFEYQGLRIIPSARLDLVSMHQRNNVGANTGVTGDEFNVEPLLGFGIEYDLPLQNVAYFNFAQGYQPLQYDQILRRGAAAPNPDSKPGETNTFELGVKGTPTDWITFDVSAFHVDYRDFIDSNEDGNDNILILNAGDVEFYGIDIAFDFNASSFIDEYFQTTIEDTVGSFGFFTAAEFLTTEIVSGPFQGNEASYAPAYTVKFGPTYRHESGIKAELTATYVDDSFWNTRNANSFTPTSTNVGTNQIDAYTVWDLALEVPIYRDHVRLIFGINNLFDEKYYARVRADGIQPTDGRNFYGGFSTTF